MPMEESTMRVGGNGPGGGGWRPPGIVGEDREFLKFSSGEQRDRSPIPGQVSRQQRGRRKRRGLDQRGEHSLFIELALITRIAGYSNQNHARSHEDFGQASALPKPAVCFAGRLDMRTLSFLFRGAVRVNSFLAPYNGFCQCCGNLGYCQADSDAITAAWAHGVPNDGPAQPGEIR
jgi:hypothetical protein